MFGLLFFQKMSARKKYPTVANDINILARWIKHNLHGNYGKLGKNERWEVAKYFRLMKGHQSGRCAPSSKLNARLVNLIHSLLFKIWCTNNFKNENLKVIGHWSFGRTTVLRNFRVDYQTSIHRLKERKDFWRKEMGAISRQEKRTENVFVGLLRNLLWLISIWISLTFAIYRQSNWKWIIKWNKMM